jgi:hypothetical protein
MDPRDQLHPDQLESLASAFREQLMACLGECAHGRRGLFSAIEISSGADEEPWPEADRLRELALALQNIFAQQEKQNALCDEFLDLCSIHGESNPGERKLARAFLARIEKGEVATKPAEGKKPW